jgi:hypothetical protein
MAVSIALSLFATFLILPGFHYPIPPAALHQSFANFVFSLLFAVPVLPVVTSLSLGEVPAAANPPSRAAKLRRWTFLSAKFVFVLLTAYCGSHILAYDSAPFIPAGIQLNVLVWGCIFAFRWALIDQRQRCPTCLRLLTNPVWIGEPSRYFLTWNCTELMCPSGHGFLYVPESPTSWFSAQRWVDLDASWSGLFSNE